MVTGTFIEVRCGDRRDYHAHVPCPKSLSKANPKATPKALNAIVLVLDSVSRNLFHDRLPETVSLLERFSSNSSSSLEIFEFFRFSSLAVFSNPNYAALLRGLMTPEKEGWVNDYKPTYLWELEGYSRYLSLSKLLPLAHYLQPMPFLDPSFLQHGITVLLASCFECSSHYLPVL